MSTKILIVDDSALIRKMIGTIVTEAEGFELVGTAQDPYDAREKIKRLRPDVLTLDVEMPRMDGLTFLQNLMRLRPMPVVMLSSLTEKGGRVSLRALELGAVDVIAKPKDDLVRTLPGLRTELLTKLNAAARARVSALHADPIQPVATELQLTHGLVALGASTGGTESIRKILEAFPADAPATVITQHMPPGFSRLFAETLNQKTRLSVSEAAHDQELKRGHAYVAPGGRHLEIERSGARFFARLTDGPAVNRHRPSVDVMFASIARSVGSNCVAALLTGMGEDGARGLLALRQAGAHTIAQDEQSCVVFGMPKAAMALGAAAEVLGLGRIPEALLCPRSEGAEHSNVA